MDISEKDLCNGVAIREFYCDSYGEIDFTTEDCVLGCVEGGDAVCNLPSTPDDFCKIAKEGTWSPTDSIKGFEGTEAECDSIAPLVVRSDYVDNKYCCHIGDA